MSHARGLLHDFHDLMRHRIEEILLVASPYDAFILEEGGRLNELILRESVEPPPRVMSAATGAEALERLGEGVGSRLVVTALRVADMNAAELVRRAREAGHDVPFVLLAFDVRDLRDFWARHGSALQNELEGAFLWQGDVRLLPAIVKLVEDRRNVEHDTREGGVQVILLIEDSVRHWSSFLPTIYDELLTQSQRVIAEGMNLSHKLMRLRARPKILLCRTFEEAWEAFRRYEEEILAVVSDVEFPRGGHWSRRAGVDLARAVRQRVPDVPVVLQSSHTDYGELARAVGAFFLVKGSPTLLNDLRRFMVDYFGFGDFVFRLPDGTEVGRARDLFDLEEKLKTVPAASIAYHGERNHFSKWLKARTEFALAYSLRPGRVTDFATHEDIRRSLLDAIADYRREQNRGIVADFDARTFDPTEGLFRIGGGSLGGKARGLAFGRRLLSEHHLSRRFSGVEISVPLAVVLGTDVFDRFLDENDLRGFAIEAEDEEEVLARFLKARFPQEARDDLAGFVASVKEPLAVRSSSLLEDSQYQPFTGVYETVLFANRGAETQRLARLLDAVKRVFASTFSRKAKGYIRATPFRLEEEKMAVILQRLVGTAHADRFYPDLAGVARSHNFYPTPPLASADGIAAVALGLGKTVVEGGNCIRFCPRHPRQLEPFSSISDALDNSQREFWALRLSNGAGGNGIAEERYGLDMAEADGTLASVASTWSEENDAVYDGLSRRGVRLVSFAPILKQGLFPLAGILEALLEAGSKGMGAPVEIEFAASLCGARSAPAAFGFLQMRPLALTREMEELEIGNVPPDDLLCRSDRVLGHGKVDDVHDLVVVDFHRFERAKSVEAAEEIARLNAELVAQGTPYVLIGVGRWGSRDPWLGIPVRWDQISGARAIVEAGLKDYRVTPSQGSHFFQNLTSFNVGYFTVNPDAGEGFVDWDWLDGHPAVHEAAHVRHLRLDAPVVVKMNGKKNAGVIFKPGAGG